MQAYSSEALAPLTAASPEWSLSSRRQGADTVVASGPVERPFDAATAAQTLASLLLEGLGDQDLAVLARRLMPHMVEGHLDHARAHSAYTVASLAAELGVSAKAVRCAIARHELRAVKRGSRWIISADAVGEWATAPQSQHATARRRPAPLPPAPKAAGPSLRSVLCGESRAARRGVRGDSR
jgi:excisionase family DNA binding protein